MAGVTAQAADGSVHEFADGTSPAVIDRVMKRYAQNKANPTSVSATPTGPMAAIRQFGVDVAGRTAERARPYLEASQATQAKYRKPGLAGALEAYNPLNMASDVGNALGAISAPLAGLGDVIGTRIDPVYGKPGSGGGEQRKYGDVLQLATPLPGGAVVRGGKAAMGAVDLAAALAAARKAPGAVGGAMVAPFKAGGRILDAGATPAAEAVRSSALAKALAQKQALQKSKTTVTNLKAADIPLRKKMTDEASAQAAKGIGVSDIPEAQTLVTDLQAKLNPTGTVVTNPSVGQINLYNDIINTLSPTKGKKPPSLEQVQELRRKIAKPAFGDLEGYGAIDKIERQGLVRALNEVENAYTGGLQAPVQANYTALIAAQKETKRLEKFAPEISQAISKLEKLPPQESIKVAKSIVDKMQKRTLMSKAEYEEFIDLATAATDAKGKSAFRKKLALYGAGLIGISATGGTIAGQATGILP
jgi:hypothetical protein